MSVSLRYLAALFLLALLTAPGQAHVSIVPHAHPHAHPAWSALPGLDALALGAVVFAMAVLWAAFKRRHK